jgi:hypothetical protein
MELTINIQIGDQVIKQYHAPTFNMSTGDTISWNEFHVGLQENNLIVTKGKIIGIDHFFNETIRETRAGISHVVYVYVQLNNK